MTGDVLAAASSLTSFADAAAQAFDQVEGDPDKEGLKLAVVSRMWMEGGGVVGVTQYHVELSGMTRDQRFSCGGWSAVHDFMPGGPPTLRVRATCHGSRAGWEFSLRRQEPQGFNVRDLLLRLEHREPAVPSAEVLTDYPVEYVEQTDARYDTVSVLPDGPMGITVETVE